MSGCPGLRSIAKGPFPLTVGVTIAALVGVAILAGLGIVLFRRSRRGRTTAGRGGSDAATALEARDVFLAGINQNAACGQHRQKLIRQCQVGDAVRLVRVTDNPRNPDAVAVHRKDGRDIGELPRKIAPEIAGYLDSGTPVAARIRAIEPHEIDSGEILSGVRIELKPHRVQRTK